MTNLADKLSTRAEASFLAGAEYANNARNRDNFNLQNMMSACHEHGASVLKASSQYDDLEEATHTEVVAALQDCWGALNFILAFYDPGQRHLDTEAWKNAEAGGRHAHKQAASVLQSLKAKP